MLFTRTASVVVAGGMKLPGVLLGLVCTQLQYFVCVVSPSSSPQPRVVGTINLSLLFHLPFFPHEQTVKSDHGTPRVRLRLDNPQHSF